MYVSRRVIRSSWDWVEDSQESTSSFRFYLLHICICTCAYTTSYSFIPQLNTHAYKIDINYAKSSPAARRYSLGFDAHFCISVSNCYLFLFSPLVAVSVTLAAWEDTRQTENIYMELSSRKTRYTRGILPQCKRVLSTDRKKDRELYTERDAEAVKYACTRTNWRDNLKTSSQSSSVYSKLNRAQRGESAPPRSTPFSHLSSWSLFRSRFLQMKTLHTSQLCDAAAQKTHICICDRPGENEPSTRKQVFNINAFKVISAGTHPKPYVILLLTTDSISHLGTSGGFQMNFKVSESTISQTS